MGENQVETSRLFILWGGDFTRLWRCRILVGRLGLSLFTCEYRNLFLQVVSRIKGAQVALAINQPLCGDACDSKLYGKLIIPATLIKVLGPIHLIFF